MVTKQCTLVQRNDVSPLSVCVVWGKVVRGAHPAHVTGVTEEMGIQGEALRARFIRELLPTFLQRNNHFRNDYSGASLTPVTDCGVNNMQ